MNGVRGRPFAFVVFVAAFFPVLAHGQVVIDEIMYNPQGTDTGREWVELYNEGGSDVVMVGGTVKGSWRVSDGSNHTLTDPSGGVGRGSLTIPAGGYLVIASDPNDFISGEYGGGSYAAVKSSISLSNTGATIALLDGTGAVVDSVSYTSGQGASDDGTSLQRQADGSWIAALPTPGAASATTPYTPPDNDDTDSDTASSTDQTASSSPQTTKATTVSSYVAPPTPNLYADAGDDKTVIVGADVEFDAEAYDKNQNMLDDSTVRFMWNFGDGATAEGEAVLHHFSYPGRYAVILDIADQKFAASDEITVTAQPAQLSFSLLGDGGVAIENLAGRDLDLSGWIIRESSNAFAAQFILPPHSLILSGSSMQIPHATLGFFAASSTMLQYPNGTLALPMGESSAPASAPAPVENAPTTPHATPEPSSDSSGVGVGSPKAVEEAPVEVAPSSDSSANSSDIPASTSEVFATSSQTASAAGAISGSSYMWWIAAGLLAALGGVALVVAKYFGKREWDIVEESEK